MTPPAASGGHSPRGGRTGVLLLPLIAVAGCHRAPLPVNVPQRCGSDHEERLIETVNTARTQRGLAALQLHARLATAAERHSADMARNAFMGHTGSDDSTFDQRIEAAGYRMSYGGEVIATGYPSPVKVVAHWLRSPRHRDVVLSSDAVHMGASCVASDRRVPYWTAVVGAPLGRRAGTRRR